MGISSVTDYHIRMTPQSVIVGKTRMMMSSVYSASVSKSVVQQCTESRMCVNGNSALCVICGNTVNKICFGVMGSLSNNFSHQCVLCELSKKVNRCKVLILEIGLCCMFWQLGDIIRAGSRAGAISLVS